MKLSLRRRQKRTNAQSRGYRLQSDFTGQSRGIGAIVCETLARKIQAREIR
jgi:hypothetical protein